MKETTGKGGNFETKSNPFFGGPKSVGVRPSFAQLSNLGEALELLVAAGCAIILGATRDNGAVVFTVLDGEQRHRTYCSNDAEFHAAIEAIEDMYKKP